MKDQNPSKMIELVRAQHAMRDPALLMMSSYRLRAEISPEGAIFSRR